MKISATVIEILTFNKWSSKVYRFQKCAFLLTFHEVDSDVCIDCSRARESVEMLSCEIPDFLPPLQWPPNSPVNHAIWSKLQEANP